MPIDNRGPWTETYTGKRLHLFNPDPSEIDLESIAHGLGGMPRFSAQANPWYSVCQHSVLGSELCAPENSLAFLFHDAAEAFVLDLPSPLKHSDELKGYVGVENGLQSVIFDKFVIGAYDIADIKLTDTRMYITERNALMKPLDDWDTSVEPYNIKITPWSPKYSEAMFIKKYNELMFLFKDI
jgi:uncharacterized protein